MCRPGPQSLRIFSTPFYNGNNFGGENFLAPCSIATLTGTNLAVGITGVVYQPFFGPLPTMVNNTTVKFGNFTAPIFNVSNVNNQQSITVQVPCELSPGATQMTVTIGTGSASLNVQIRAAAPAIFETQYSAGRRAVAVKPDGSFVTPDNPARRGEAIRIYVTGLGVTSPAPISTNSPGIPDFDTTVNVGSLIVGLNNAGVPVTAARYAAGMIGVYEVTFPVPQDTPQRTDAPLVLAYVDSTGALVFSNPSAIPVQ